MSHAQHGAKTRICGHRRLTESLTAAELEAQKLSAKKHKISTGRKTCSPSLRRVQEFLVFHPALVLRILSSGTAPQPRAGRVREARESLGRESVTRGGRSTLVLVRCHGLVRF